MLQGHPCNVLLCLLSFPHALASYWQNITLLKPPLAYCGTECPVDIQLTLFSPLDCMVISSEIRDEDAFGFYFFPLITLVSDSLYIL